MFRDRHSYMELIDIRSGEACTTGLGTAYSTDTDTWRQFLLIKRTLRVADGEAEFLVDYYNAKGDLVDTVMIGHQGFEQLIGRPPESPEIYTAFDRRYWSQVGELEEPPLVKDDMWNRVDIAPDKLPMAHDALFEIAQALVVRSRNLRSPTKAQGYLECVAFINTRGMELQRQFVEAQDTPHG